MKILYINVIECNKGWGAECFVNEAFLKQGVETVTLDYRKHRGHISRKLLEVKDDFNALLLQRGDNFPLELIRAIKRPRFFWATELVSRRKDQDRLFDSGLFDHIFVRGDNCRDILIRRGILKSNQISVLLSGFDPEIHHPVPDVTKDIDVLFIGALKERRAKIIKELAKDFNIVVVRAFGKEMTEFLSRAKIVLNIHAEDYVDTETRIYEALGCGSFLITEKVGSESPFVNGRHLIEVDNIADMKEKIALYLKNESERKRIASEGFCEALEKHTYQERAKQLSSIMRASGSQAHRSGTPALDTEKIRKYKRREKIDFLKLTVAEAYSRLRNKAFQF